VTRQFAVAATALVLLSGSLAAQRDSVRRAARGQILPGGKAGRLNNPPRGSADQANLPLRQQVRQAFQARVRNELNLDQPKMRRLNQTEQSFTKQRNELGKSERETRQALATAMQDSTPDQGKIDGYINQLVQAQRKRADLLEAEQKELSSFLTPMQRAQYLALNQQLAARMRQFNQAGRGTPPAGPPPEPPPER
jgi:hypothetical protein